MKPRTLLGLAPFLPILSFTALAACAAPTDESAVQSDDALVCPGCTKVVPKPPPPTTYPVVLHPCGQGGVLENQIVSFTAGNVASQPSAIEGEPIRFAWEIDSTAPPGSALSVTLDGQPVTTTQGADYAARVSYSTPTPFNPAITPLTHTLAVSGVCGTRTQTIALTPVTESEVWFPYAELTSNIYSFTPGQTANISWDIGQKNVRIYDCSPYTAVIGWHYFSEGSNAPLRDQVAIGPTGSITTTPLEENREYQIHGSCGLHPRLTNDPIAQLNLSEAPPPAPVIKSFSTSSTYVNQNDSITLSWNVDFSYCGQNEILITGDSEDRLGTQVYKHLASASSGAGSVKVKVGEWTRYKLTAQCVPDGNQGVASSSPIDVHVYVPPSQPNGGSYCYEVTCTDSGCTTVDAWAASQSAADSGMSSTYPASSGCTYKSIGCGQLTSACPDPFAP